MQRSLCNTPNEPQSVIVVLPRTALMKQDRKSERPREQKSERPKEQRAKGHTPNDQQPNKPQRANRASKRKKNETSKLHEFRRLSAELRSWVLLLQRPRAMAIWRRSATARRGAASTCGALGNRRAAAASGHLEEVPGGAETFSLRSQRRCALRTGGRRVSTRRAHKTRSSTRPHSAAAVGRCAEGRLRRSTLAGGKLREAHVHQTATTGLQRRTRRDT